MKSKVTTVITETDNLKLERLAQRAGVTKAEAVRGIYLHGPTFFLRYLVGATKR